MFKKGDVVRLKSGGPTMTVEDTAGYDDGKIRCAWFAKDEVKSSKFHPTSLVAVDTEGGGGFSIGGR